MKITVPCVLILIIVFLASPGHAKFYKYKDANGTWRYVGDLNAVPEDQRTNVVTYKEADDALTPGQRIKKKLQEDAARRRVEKRLVKVQPKKKKSAYYSKLQDKLEKKKADLEQVKSALVKEQQTLLKFNTKLGNETEINVHKKKVAKLNNRIRVYERKRQLFELEVAKFHSE